MDREPFYLKTEQEELSSTLHQLMDTTGVFGVESMVVTSGVTHSVVAPPYDRLDADARPSRRPPEPVSGELSLYEGYLSLPMFLPIYSHLDGDWVDQLNMIRLKGNEYVWVQWLFKQRYNWQAKALAMYESYLSGNEYPLSSRIGRLFQERTLGLLNRISSSDTTVPYIDEVENKILDTGYQFQMRIGICSDEHKAIAQAINDLLRIYDSYNAIRLTPLKDRQGKELDQAFRGVMNRHTQNQILSRRELLSLFGGAQSEPLPVRSQAAPVGDIIGLLPKYTRESPEPPEGIVQRVAEALKRVNIIKTARLYNETVVTGVRLTVIQFDIPKNKNLTNIIQKGKDIQAALGVPSLSVEQGDQPDTVRLSIPNTKPAVISLRELLEQESFQRFSKDNPLPFAVGVSEIDEPIYLSLSKLVHLLVAGTTGSGKSVFINSMAVTLLTRYTPEEMQMYMIDPKEVEFGQYEDFPHVREVVTDMAQAEAVLSSLVNEMQRRYSLFKSSGSKNILLHNEKSDKKLPFIVCMIDEYADLKDTNPEVEDHVARLGQKARAAGIHMVLATQRPSADLISSRVKAVIPNAISFNLNSNNNYKTVFGTGTPYKLLGRGDGVMKIEGYPKEFQRFQSAIISPDESEEAGVYQQLANYFEPRKEVEVDKSTESPDSDPEPEEGNLYKLKQLIANTGETRIAPLREYLGVKTTTMTQLMGQLVTERWLVKHESKAKGYEVIAPESVLEEWRSEK